MLSCPEVFEPPPLWLAPASNFMVFLTVPTSIYMFYLVIAITPPHTDFHYKMYLLSYHVVTTVYSVFNALSMIVHYMPALLFIELGILQISTFMFIISDLLLQSLVVLLALLVLLYRFLIVVYGICRKDTIQTVLFISSILYIVPQIFLVLHAFNLYTPEHDKKNLLKDCPHMKPLADFYEPVYVNDPSFIKIAALAFLVVTFACIICFVVVILFCLLKFREKTQFLTETTKKLQTRLLFNLAITISIPCFAHALPAITGSLILFLDVQVPIWIPTLLWFLGSFHGFMNCIVFIWLNDNYFNEAKKSYTVLNEDSCEQNVPDLGEMTAFMTTVLPTKKMTSEIQTQTI